VLGMVAALAAAGQARTRRDMDQPVCTARQGGTAAAGGLVRRPRHDGLLQDPPVPDTGATAHTDGSVEQKLVGPAGAGRSLVVEFVGFFGGGPQRACASSVGIAQLHQPRSPPSPAFAAASTLLATLRAVAATVCTRTLKTADTVDCSSNSSTCDRTALVIRRLIVDVSHRAPMWSRSSQKYPTPGGLHRRAIVHAGL
jgi:hypothetical protein